MSPRGDRVQLGYSHIWASGEAAFEALFGTALDGVKTFSEGQLHREARRRSVDWGDPRPRAVSETHGAWSWGWQMSGRKRGFSFVGTDGTFDSNAYGHNSILAIRHQDARIWRVASLPHQYADYFSEVQWALSPLGLLLHGSLNWQNAPSPRLKDEVYLIKLDSNWNTNVIWN